MGRRRAFTVLDLLLAVGVLLIGLAIVLPLIETAQRSARRATCASNLRLLLQGVQLYAGTYNNALPGGPWTSAAHLRREEDFRDPFLIPAGVTTRPTDKGDDVEPGAGPVSVFDYLTPIAEVLGMKEAGLPGRARYLALVNHRMLRCPENNLPAVPTGDLTWPITRAPSYRTNQHFLLRSSAYRENPPVGVLGLYVTPASNQVPFYYTPRLDRVGEASRKAFFVESAGVLDARLRRLTYPTGVFKGQTFGGALSGPPPYLQRYDNTPASPPNPLLLGNVADHTQLPKAESTDQLLLLATARHGTRQADAPLSDYQMNLGFLDGHVESLSVLEALKPSFHSPTGTMVTFTRALVYPRILARYSEGHEVPGMTIP